jgi:hypothetical protein
MNISRRKVAIRSLSLGASVSTSTLRRAEALSLLGIEEQFREVITATAAYIFG